MAECTFWLFRLAYLHLFARCVPLVPLIAVIAFSQAALVRLYTGLLKVGLRYRSDEFGFPVITRWLYRLLD